jgi:RimJ/RimL family protein N-acetyltransferase
MRIDLAAKKANIGRFDHAKTGKGYGTKAKKLFTGSVFDGTPITKLV